MPKVRLNPVLETERYFYKNKIFTKDTDVEVTNEQFDALMDHTHRVLTKSGYEDIPYFVEVAPKKGRPKGSGTKKRRRITKPKTTKEEMEQEVPDEEVFDNVEETVEV